MTDSRETTTYGWLLTVHTNDQYVTPQLNFRVHEVSVDEHALRQVITDQVRKLALFPGSVGGMNNDTVFSQYKADVLRDAREGISKDVRAMGANGRLGMNEEQLELLCAAIKGRAEQALKALEKKQTGNEALAGTVGALTDIGLIAPEKP